MFRLGIDMGGTAIKTGVMDEEMQVISRHSVPTQGSFEQVVSDMAQAAREAAGKIGLRLEDFPCVGVGTPSCINPYTGKLVFSNNTNWRNVPLREELEKHIPVPVYIGNDADCAVIGETVAGGAKGKRDVLMITLGTGVGCGIILGGKLFSGADGMGAELGHTPLIYGGAECTCGSRGCLEAYASLLGLIRITREAMDRHPESAMHRYLALEEGEITGKTSFECAKAGDAAANEVVDEYLEYVANGIGGAINVFRPEVVLVGGGISNAGEFLFSRLEKKLGKYVFAGDIIGCPPVRRAILGNDAGLVGAACLDLMQEVCK